VKRAWLLVIPVLLVGIVPPANAASRRPVFEPEDLEMETPGRFDFDLGAGLVRDGVSWRTIAPDFELDLGLTEHTELGLDGTFSWASESRQRLRPITPVHDNLWLSLKHALWSASQEDQGTAQAFGIQHGVRLPFAPHSTGPGYQILALLGTSAPRRKLVFNLGVFTEPRTTQPNLRPWGLLVGVDFEFDLDDAEAWQVTGSLAATGHGEDGSGEVTLTAGINRSLGDALDVYVQGIGGWLNGGPAIGAIAGFSPKVQLW
jgi:hypothetical protein